METEAALRALKKRKGPVGIQILALGVGLATTLLCLQLFGLFQQAPQIKGADCTAGIRRLVLRVGDQGWEPRFTAAQADLLRQSAPGLVFRVAPLSMEVEANGRARKRHVTAADVDLLSRICVNLDGGRLPLATENEAVVHSLGKVGDSVRVGVARFEVSGTSKEFKGLSQNDGASVYIPMERLQATGFNLGKVDIPTVVVLADVSLGAERLLGRLSPVVREHPGIFGPNATIEVQNLLPIGPDEAKRLEKFVAILALMSMGFLLQGLLTVLSYQFGRTGSLAQSITLLRELGASRGATLRYGIVEPAVVFGSALLIAIAGEAALGSLVSKWLNLSADIAISVSWRAKVLLITACAVLLSTLAMGLLVRSLSEQGLSRSLRRKVQRAYGYVAAAQVLVSCLVMLPAVAAALAFWISIPSARGYNIENVRVHPVFLPAYKIPDDFQGRIQSFFDSINSSVSGPTAISWSTYPVPGVSGLDGQIAHSGRKIVAEINPVTESYFSVLNMKLSQGRMFSLADMPRTKDETPKVAIANREAQKALGISHLPWGPIEIGKKKTSFFRAKVSVVGIVDEKTSGNDSAGSEDRLRPALYVPWRPQGPFVVMVRHEDGESEKADRAVASALDRYVPQWRTADLPTKPISLKDLYGQATAQQRTAFSMFGSLASGALLMGLLGLLGATVMTLSLNRVSYAIRQAMGASHRQLLVHHGIVVATPILSSLFVAAIVCAIAADPILELMVLPEKFKLTLGSVAVGVVALSSFLGLAISLQIMRREKLSDFLRMAE